jgi:hypothetical protein
VSPTYSLKIVPLWDASREPTFQASGAKCCRFPPKWKTLCGAEIDQDLGRGATVAVWNAAHPLFRSIDAESVAWCKETFKSSLDPLPHKAALLTVTGRCAGWIMKCLNRAAADLWDGLKERDASFLPEVLGRLLRRGSSSSRPSNLILCQWVGSGSRLRVLSPDGWKVYGADLKEDQDQIEHYLPDPGPNWRLEIDITEKADPYRPWAARRIVWSPKNPKPRWWYP